MGCAGCRPVVTQVQELLEIPHSLGCGDSESGSLGEVCVDMVSSLCDVVGFPVGQSRISGFAVGSSFLILMYLLITIFFL